MSLRECALMNQSTRYDSETKWKYPGGVIFPSDRELKNGWQFWIHENEAIDLGIYEIVILNASN